jgi:thiosulfate/3-mercaptopyruvate sulfurtransferase
MFEVKDYEASKLYVARKCRYSFCVQTLTVVLVAILSAGLLIPDAFAGGCCGGGTWDPSAFLNSDEPGVQAAKTSSSNQAPASNRAQSATQPVQRSNLFPNGQIIKPLQSVSSSDLVLDVSNDNSYGRSHIKGALLVPSKNFLNDDGTIKSVPEMTKILSNAGISPKDSVVVYSNSPCEAAFAFWTLRYLGQDNVKVLDGGLNDWNAAGLPNEASQNIKPAAEYTPNPKSEMLADYDYVKSGSAQLIDTRSFTEFGKGRIPGATSLDLAEVLQGSKVKNGSDLANMFSKLNKDKPVTVYSGDYYQASLLWYALQLMGYKGNIYTWQDWAAHQPVSEKKETVPAGKSTANADRFKKLGTT